MIKTESVPQLPILLLNRKALLFFPWPDETLLWSSILDLSSFHPPNSPKLLQWLYKQGNWGWQGLNPHDCGRELSLGPAVSCFVVQSIHSDRLASQRMDKVFGETQVLGCSDAKLVTIDVLLRGKVKAKHGTCPYKRLLRVSLSLTHTAKVESWRTFCTATKAEE